MTRRTTEILWVAALTWTIVAFWAVLHGRQISAITYALNGVTIAVLAVASVLGRREP